MTFKWIVPFGAALLIAASSGACYAQEDASFYADPVLLDPPQHVAHPLPSALATADVAAVSPAAGEKLARDRTALCNAFNPCARATATRG